MRDPQTGYLDWMLKECDRLGWRVWAGAVRSLRGERDRLRRERTLLRRVLSEYLAGNRIVDGYWYSPDERGEPHFKNDAASAEELALLDSLRQEFGL